MFEEFDKVDDVPPARYLNFEFQILYYLLYLSVFEGNLEIIT